MKKYIQFMQLSTGYVPGSIPPRFDEDYKKPIDACGSDSVYPLDGRWCSATVHAVARLEAVRRKAVAYKLCHGLTCNGWLQESRPFFVSNGVKNEF